MNEIEYHNEKEKKYIIDNLQELYKQRKNLESKEILEFIVSARTFCFKNGLKRIDEKTFISIKDNTKLTIEISGYLESIVISNIGKLTVISFNEFIFEQF